MTMQLILLLTLAALFTTSNGFQGVFVGRRTALSSARRISLSALNSEAIAKLEDIQEKFKRLSNVDSPEANEESAKLKETAEKYATYVEVKKMMTKLRLMYINEVSDRRKAKQLKSFVKLYKGNMEVEDILKSKLGIPHDKAAAAEGVAEIERWDAEIARLENQLNQVEIKLPAGTSTREERFN